MTLRRLRIFGVATALSAVAALIGIVLYLPPKAQLPAFNRMADYVVLNDATLWLHGQPAARGLRLIAIDEQSVANPGGWMLGQPPANGPHLRLTDPSRATLGSRAVRLDEFGHSAGLGSAGSLLPPGQVHPSTLRDPATSRGPQERLERTP